MNVLLVIGAGFALLLIASRTYPFWIARVFRQDDSNSPPSERFADGREFVKTPSHIVFAHHFASIAGAGPIVGPIIALAFGWGPAWLWIVLGGIFYGAVHDMSAMFVSVRESGRTIAEIARRTLGNFGYLLFVAFLLIVISFVNAIFLKLSAGALTSAYPLEFLGPEASHYLRVLTDPVTGVEHGRIGGIATTSVILMTLAAPILGWLIHRRRLPGAAAFGIASVVCVGSVLAGFAIPVTLTADTWMIVLAAYVFFAYSKDAYDALWPYFGSGNQLIGALALTTVAIWLMQRGRSYWFALIPAAFMVATAISALGFTVAREWHKAEEGAARFIVGGAGALLLALAAGFVIIAAMKLRAAAGRLPAETRREGMN